MKTDIKKILASKTKQALSSNILSADAIRQNIVILPELKNLIPALSPEELEQLESNILQHGCQTPIQLWQAAKQQIGLASQDSDDIVYVLIDGHNRHAICKRHNLNFEVYMLSFPSIKEAKDYMINLQLGRRNLSLSQISYFRGLRYNNEKSDKAENLKHLSSKGHFDPSSEKGQQAPTETTFSSKGHFDPSMKNGQQAPTETTFSSKGHFDPSSENGQQEPTETTFSSKGHFDPSSENGQQEPTETTFSSKGHFDPSGVSTAERLSKEYNVSPKTIKRDAEFAKGLEKLDLEFRNNILSGKEKIDKGLIQKLAKMQDLEKPISGMQQLVSLVGTNTNETANTTKITSAIQEKAVELMTISKKFVKTNSRADLEQMIALAQQTLAAMS